MNNPNSYVLQAKARYIYQSDSQQQQYQFHEANIIRTQKSMSLASVKNNKTHKQNQTKKSNSFLLLNKKINTKIAHQQKQKSKTSKTSKKCLNITQNNKKPPINSKNSMNKTSVSIGSVSGKSIKTAKKKVNNANTKSNKDYLILDQQIFLCQNMQQINEKLICGNNNIYSHQRFIKATLKNTDKIQNYLLTFKQYIKYNITLRQKYTTKNNINIDILSQQQKKNLYIMLRNETIQQKQSKIQKQYGIQHLIKQACYKIEQKTKQKIIQHPQQQQEIRQWKNKRLHQLLELQSCLQQYNSEQVQEQDEVCRRPENSQNSFNNSGETVINQITQSYKIQQNIQTKTSLQPEPIKFRQNNNIPNKYGFQQKYPQNFHMIPNELPKYLPDDHLISKLGIQKFLHNLWDFLIDSQLIIQFINNLKIPYGISNKDKQQIVKQSEMSQSLFYFQQNQNPILHNQIFIKFCIFDQSTIANLCEQQQKSIIIYEKLIFDALNLQLTKYQIDFPYGSYYPLESNFNNSGYLINQENAMIVWEQCINNIFNANDVGLGLLLEVEDQDMNKMVKNNNQKCWKQIFKQQNQFYFWDKNKPITRRKAFEVLIQAIWNSLINQVITQITKI